MKHVLKTLLLSALALMLALAPAMAEEVSFSGTVTAAYSHDVYTSFNGYIEHIGVAAGEAVTPETAVAALRTTKVYAETSGSIAAVFGQAGDSLDTLTTRYGAALYIDDGVHYTLSASTDGSYAYDSVETKFVQVGESVHLRSRSDEDRTGTGLITAVDGAAYTVEVTSGSFIAGESVNVYRTADYADTQRIGRGDIANKAPVAVTGTGRIVSLAVKAGDTVQQGDLLMETLEGSLPASGISATLNACSTGVVAQLHVTQGSAVTEGALIATIWPAEAMQIEALIPEADLASLAVGDAVNILFDWQEDDAQIIPGTVTAISAAPDADAASTCYTAYISFTPDSAVRYGMNVTVETIE